MPTYEYACRSCGEHLEIVQSFKDDPLTTCPSCEGALRKVFSAAGIIFKGSGWHIKDYAGKSGGASEPAKEGTKAKEAASAGDSGGSSDTAASKESSSGSDSSSGKAESSSGSTSDAKSA